MAKITEGDTDEEVALALFAWMVDTTETYLNSMFIRGRGEPFKLPALKLDTAGKRPRFTHALTPSEQLQRFEDPALRQANLQRLPPGSPEEQDYTERMRALIGRRQ